jgi:hypothetical protein
VYIRMTNQNESRDFAGPIIVVSGYMYITRMRIYRECLFCLLHAEFVVGEYIL